MNPRDVAELVLKGAALALALAGERPERVGAKAGVMAQRGQELLKRVTDLAEASTGETPAPPPPPREPE